MYIHTYALRIFMRWWSQQRPLTGVIAADSLVTAVGARPHLKLLYQFVVVVVHFTSLRAAAGSNSHHSLTHLFIHSFNFRLYHILCWLLAQIVVMPVICFATPLNYAESQRRPCQQWNAKLLVYTLVFLVLLVHENILPINKVVFVFTILPSCARKRCVPCPHFEQQQRSRARATGIHLLRRAAAAAVLWESGSVACANRPRGD